MRILNQDEIETIRPTFTAIQIICASLIMGPVFMFLVLYFVREEPKFTESLDMVAIFGLVFGAGTIMASFIVPVITLNKSASRVDLKKAPPLIQTSTIIRYALIEGGMMAQIMLWFTMGSVYLLMGAGLGLAIMLFFFPTSHRIISKVEQIID